MFEQILPSICPHQNIFYFYFVTDIYNLMLSLLVNASFERNNQIDFEPRGVEDRVVRDYMTYLEKCKRGEGEL